MTARAPHAVKGNTSHDARVVAAMLRHGLSRILTFNAEHFRRFDEIQVLTPAEMDSRSD